MRQLTALALLVCGGAAHAAVTGHAMDEEGKPLRGVRVQVRARETSEQWHARLLSKTPEAVVLATAETGDDGAFRVETKGHSVVEVQLHAPGRFPASRDIADGDYAGAAILRAGALRRGRITANGNGIAGAVVVHNSEVVARTDASGHYEALPRRVGRIIVVHPEYGVNVSRAAANAELPYDVELQPVPPIEGRVVDASGAPVKDAVIRVEDFPLATSGEDGAFRISHGVSDARTIVAREGNRVGSLLLSEAKAPYVIRLRPAASIAGITRSTRDERPVSSTRVCARSNTGEAIRWTCVLSDAKGGYVVDGLESGTHRLSINHPAYLRFPDDDVAVAEGARANQALVLTPYSRLAGKVMDDGKRPVAAARVEVEGDESTMSAPDGTFSLRVTHWRPETLRVTKTSFATQHAGPFSVEAGETKRGIEIVLTRGLQLVVHAVDRQGLPLAGEPVRVAQKLEPRTTRTVSCDRGECVTDKAGQVTLQVVEGTYDITAGGVNAVARRMAAMVIDARTPVVTIELDRGVNIAGRTVWSDGTPAVIDGEVRTAGDPPVTAKVEKGVFTLRNVMPGPLTLSVEAGAPLHMLSDPLDVTAPATDVKVILPRPGRIEGSVSSRESGEPLREFTVTLRPKVYRSSTSRQPKQFKDAGGKFVLDAVAPDAYDVVVKARGYTSASTNLSVNEGETATASLQLERGGSVAGRVTSGGRAVIPAFISARSTTGEWRNEPDSTQTDENGRYTLEGVPPGSREIAISAPGFVDTAVNVDVVAGRETRADVELSRGRELRGRVVDEEGRPVAAAMVVTQPSWTRATTDAGGSFRLTGVSDAKVTVIASKDGYRNGTAIVDPGPAHELTITLGRGGTITGHVRGLTPAEVTAVEVKSINTATPSLTQPIRPDASGAFTLTGVADGQVMVIAELGGARPRRLHSMVQVQNGVAPPVELDFAAGIGIRGRVTAHGRPVQGQIAFAVEGQQLRHRRTGPRRFVRGAGPGTWRISRARVSSRHGLVQRTGYRRGRDGSRHRDRRQFRERPRRRCGDAHTGRGRRRAHDDHRSPYRCRRPFHVRRRCRGRAAHRRAGNRLRGNAPCIHRCQWHRSKPGDRAHARHHHAGAPRRREHRPAACRRGDGRECGRHADDLRRRSAGRRPATAARRRQLRSACDGRRLRAKQGALNRARPATDAVARALEMIR